MNEQRPPEADEHPVEFALNPRLDLDEAAKVFSRDGLVRIPDFLTASAAEALLDVVHRKTPWKLVHNAGPADVDEGVVRVSPEDLEREPWSSRNELQRELDTRAARGEFSFVYQAFLMIDEYLAGGYPGHPLHAMLEFLNTPEMHNVARKISSCPDLTKLDAQATFYAPGQFLNKHNDMGEHTERRAAYVLSLAKDWKLDYGGNFTLLDDHGRVERELTPEFNTVTIFRVPRDHAVTRVADSAPIGRYAITGWFRDDPVHAM